jgi:N-acetylglucosamine-6-phosphate deacetylase
MPLMGRHSLFDIQINGFAGVDLQQDELSGGDLRLMVEALAEQQTLRWFATLITDAVPRMEARLARMESLRAADHGTAAAVCGYHLEGPWLSPEPGYRGAHDPRWMESPDPTVLERFQQAAGGMIRLITMAPELPGSAEFIRHARKLGMEVSIGHSQADGREIAAAVEAGARFCTHVGNGVPAQLHRHDNIVQRLLARDELTAFFIPDGIHLPPEVLQNFFRAKPAGRALFTTDAMAAAGAPPGRYRLGALDLEVGTDRVVRLPGQPFFAGSALTPLAGLANAARWLGLTESSARALFSTAVGQAFGIDLPELDAA